VIPPRRRSRPGEPTLFKKLEAKSIIALDLHMENLYSSSEGTGWEGRSSGYGFHVSKFAWRHLQFPRELQLFKECRGARRSGGTPSMRNFGWPGRWRHENAAAPTSSPTPTTVAQIAGEGGHVCPLTRAGVPAGTVHGTQTHPRGLPTQPPGLTERDIFPHCG